jgi:hypothetical protein
MADQTTPSTPTGGQTAENADAGAVDIEVDIQNTDGESQNLSADIDTAATQQQAPDGSEGEESEKSDEPDLSDEQTQTLLDLAKADPETAEALEQLGEENPQAFEELINYLEEIQTSAGGDDTLGLSGKELGDFFRASLRELLDAQRNDAQGGISGDSDFAGDSAQGGLSNDSTSASQTGDSTDSNDDQNRSVGDGGTTPVEDENDTVASTPNLSTADAATQEDVSVALDVSAALTDTDGSETLAIVISGIPAGATLVNDDGPITVSGGAVTLTADQLQGLAITPPADSDADFTLTVAATSTESDGGDTATVTQTIDLTVSPVADAPVVTTQNVSGDEDSAIALNLAANLGDTDGSESLALQITGVPAGATLSHGTDQGGGVWSIDQTDLGDVTLTPPGNFSGDIALQLVATSTDGSDTATTAGSFTVSVAGVADTPSLTAIDVSGNEDSAIALDLSAAVTDPSETLAVQLSGVPAGATLSHGTDMGSGVWSVDPADLGAIEITPPENFSGVMNLQLQATSTDGSDSASLSANFAVSVGGIADTPVTTAGDVSGSEDGTVALNLSAALTDTSETLSTQITGIPAGATLSAGTNEGGGVWTVDPADLGSLVLTPPADFSGDINLQLVATSTDGTDTATTTDGFTVSVAGVADTPTANASDVSGSEDGAIALNLSAALTDTSETLSTQITGVPDGAVLSAGTDQGGGIWSIDPADLASLEITPPENFSGTMNLALVATSTDGTDSASNTQGFTVSVAGVADAPVASANDVSGDEDSAIALDLSAALDDSSETLSVQLTGVPAGATLSAGTDQGGGVWTIDPADLGSVTITPPADFSGSMNLQLQATSTDGSDTATTNAPFTVTVAGVADAPTATANDVSGNEDSAIALDLSASLTDATETLSAQISGVPAGATLSAGTDQGGGVWSIDPADLGSVTITPPSDFSGSINLTLTATSTDGSDTATTSDTFTVTVSGVADAPTATANDVAGNEDSAIALDLAAGLTDATETLSAQISGVPAGATLSAGTDQGGGVWSIDPADLGSVTITPPSDFSGSINLTLTATSSDGSDTATTSDAFTVTVSGVADAPTATANDVAGNEDSAIALDLAASLNDSSETLTAQISGVPSGATLSHGTDQGGGVWSVDPADLGSVEITPPSDSSGSFNLTLTATSADGADSSAPTASP